jgi:hypothetical protein
VEGEAAERKQRRTARISAEQRSVSGGERSDDFQFIVANLDPSVVRDVDVMVRTTTMNEHEPMQDATPRIPVVPAMLVGEYRPVTVAIPRTFSRRRDLALWGRWRDDLDDHEEALTPIEPLS